MIPTHFFRSSLERFFRWYDPFGQSGSDANKSRIQSLAIGAIGFMQHRPHFKDIDWSVM